MKFTSHIFRTLKLEILLAFWNIFLMQNQTSENNKLKLLEAKIMNLVIITFVFFTLLFFDLLVERSLLKKYVESCPTAIE